MRSHVLVIVIPRLAKYSFVELSISASDALCGVWISIGRTDELKDAVVLSNTLTEARLPRWAGSAVDGSVRSMSSGICQYMEVLMKKDVLYYVGIPVMTWLERENPFHPKIQMSQKELFQPAIELPLVNAILEIRLANRWKAFHS